MQMRATLAAEEATGGSPGAQSAGVASGGRCELFSLFFCFCVWTVMQHVLTRDYVILYINTMKQVKQSIMHCQYWDGDSFRTRTG